jgi:hypothetical protein
MTPGFRLLAAAFLGASLTGCNMLTRLAEVGSPPPLTQIQNPVHAPHYQRVSMPMPAPVPVPPVEPDVIRVGPPPEAVPLEVAHDLRRLLAPAHLDAHDHVGLARVGDAVVELGDIARAKERAELAERAGPLRDGGWDPGSLVCPD